MADRTDLIRDLQAAMTNDLLPDAKPASERGVFSPATISMISMLGPDKLEERDMIDAFVYFKEAARELENSEIEERKRKAKFCLIAAKAIKESLGSIGIMLDM